MYLRLILSEKFLSLTFGLFNCCFNTRFNSKMEQKCSIIFHNQNETKMKSGYKLQGTININELELGYSELCIYELTYN
jgi:hypothetical protein